MPENDDRYIGFLGIVDHGGGVGEPEDGLQSEFLLRPHRVVTPEELVKVGRRQGAQVGERPVLRKLLGRRPVVATVA